MAKAFNKISNMSLRVKISALALLVNIAVAVGAFFNMQELAVSYKKANLQELEMHTKSIANAIANPFYENYKSVQLVAKNEAVRTLKTERLDTDLNEYVKLNPTTDLILVLDRNGNFVASNSQDAKGKPVNKEQLSKFNFAQEPWFHSTINGEYNEDSGKGLVGTHVRDLHLDPELKAAFGEERFSIGFSTQIKNYKNELVGVIVSKTNSRWYDQAIEEFYESVKNTTPNVEIYVLNKEGHPILRHHPAENQNKENVVKNDRNWILKENYFQEESEISKALFEKKSGVGYEKNTNTKENFVIGYGFMNSSKWLTSMGWSVLLKDAEKEAMAAVDKAMFNFYLVASVISFFMFLVSTWAGIFLSKSVEKITHELAGNSVELGDAANKIAVSAAQLSESVTEQSSALQETMATTDQISSMIEKNADAAEKSKELSSESRQLAEQGQKTMDNMLLAISEIEANNEDVTLQMNHTNTQLTEITKLIHNISNKTKVINEIVFQTKLLSFNASVEAARAGEYGKGFAVVAEEVGKLAQMSGTAAKEISDMLHNSVSQVEKIIQETTAKVDDLTEKSKEKVSYGAETAKQCKKDLEEIAATVKSVDQLVSEIATASKEQSSGIVQIAQAMGQVESVTNQNNMVAQSSSVASEQLKHQADVLKHMVEDLAHFIRGNSSNKLTSDIDHVEGRYSNPERLDKISRAEAVKATLKTNVVPLESTKKKKENDFQPILKNAAGYDGKIPSSDDPGFSE